MSKPDLKRVLLLKLLINMENTVSDDDLKTTIDRIKSTVVHTAPEILDLRWKSIYHMCVQYMNDFDNPEHDRCFELYSQALEEYKTLL